MGKAIYMGVDGVARKIKQPYIGVDGVARKVKKEYVGVSGVARECYGGSGVLNGFSGKYGLVGYGYYSDQNSGAVTFNGNTININSKYGDILGIKVANLYFKEEMYQEIAVPAKSYVSVPLEFSGSIIMKTAGSNTTQNMPNWIYPSCDKPGTYSSYIDRPGVPPFVSLSWTGDIEYDEEDDREYVSAGGTVSTTFNYNGNIVFGRRYSAAESFQIYGIGIDNDPTSSNRNNCWTSTTIFDITINKLVFNNVKIV